MLTIVKLQTRGRLPRRNFRHLSDVLAAMSVGIGDSLSTELVDFLTIAKGCVVTSEAVNKDVTIGVTHVFAPLDRY